MIIGILNIKGGVGKTTTAMALATAASRDGGAVTVVDTDPQGSATLWEQASQDNSAPLPFPVVSRNKAEIRRMRSNRPDSNGEIIFIDCPPNGDVISETIKTSDFVIIPSTASPIDLQQTMATCEACQDAGTDYAVLIVMARRGTSALASFRHTIEESGAGIFDTEIPLRESIKNTFGYAFRSNLSGYEDAWNELKEAVK
ncbi:ParA family protein [Bifidobacterium sp. SO4]|uniref:ParA family protein n=1 Tax=Bifidobacterium sp. SO4 TaxID=2809030 RepID=UPI001BDD1DFC|nr:ParA family protein [Bifidobacterium sp. SO4]MBT1171745.1 ParA family protein [Bifidobacterium sp. SO4]